MKRLLKKIWKKLKYRLKYRSNIDYWEERAGKLNTLSVLNKKHGIEEVESVTSMQEAQIFPLLSKYTTGVEENILDFGCGPGRFSSRLAKRYNCKVIGVDPIKHLIDLAPKDINVDYLQIKNNKIPVEDDVFDIIWICLVLGGIENKYLKRTVKEIKRVSKENALICLVENTSKKANNQHWYFRSTDTYSEIFGAEFNEVGRYKDLGEDISIMIARV